MAFSYSCLTLQRVVLPTVLVLAALSRPVGISFVYLLMFFISPFIPVATQRNFKGTVTAYFIILIALSTILLLCHIALQVIIIALKIDTLFGTCSFTEQLLRHVGFVDLRNISILAITEWLAPDVAVFITSLATYLVTKKLTVPPSPIQVENGEVNETRDSALSADVVEEEHPNFQRLIKISPLFCLATLFFAAVLRPSVPGGFYFLIFLLSGSYWATFQSLQRGFAVLLRFVMIVIVLHAICIVAYQTPWMQEHLDSKSLAARLVGLEPLIISKCANDIRIITYDTNFKFDSFLNPIVLFFSYYALALTSNNLIVIVVKPATAFGQQLENGSKFSRQVSLATQTSRGSKKDSWTKKQRLNVSLRRQQRPVTTIEPTETTPLVQRHGTIKRKSSTTNVTSADIPLEMHDDKSLDFVLTSTICDQIWYGIASIGGFIYQNSYIFTNILMMTWSIVYHSWLTFVLLLWANVLWMIPNQRKAMMRSSPFIVIYAELLLIAQYIYGMDLNNDELPSKVDTAGINLAQIGLERPQENGMQPCVPLIVKTAFLLMFWVTSRQFFKEKVEKRRSTLADMIAPLQLGFTSSDIGPSSGRKTSKFLKMAGDIIKYLLVRLWIWLLVLVIFLCAITGKQMTGFRICYMALFLFFLLVFQSSSKVWVKVMYGFWLFLIFYAMSILILIYTYQFDKFDQYWYDYLNISKTLQTDIGLERYKTKDLFLHLVSPTIIVILTVIQVHYFHKRFIATLQEPVIPTPREPASLNIYAHKGSRIGSRHSSIAPPNNVLTDTTALIRLTLKQILKKIKRILKNFKNLFWRFLEVHIIKAVYITAFVCAVSEVCLLHVAFVTLCLIGVISRSSVQVFISRIISFIVTIIIISKMIYQIAYLHHDKYDVHCPKSNYTENNAAWFGLIKASPETGGLIGLLKKYIIYMVMVTLHAVVSLRQLQMRTLNGTQNESIPKVLFPLITRADAEKNLEKMTKYLLNYGFFKFGLEISLITLVATIAFRQDIIAVAYAFWLPVLLVFDRSKCSKIWGILQIFVFFSLLLQYVVLVGLPPSLCLTYPWVESSYSHSIQRWAMLPGPLHYNHVPKLIFDFILLLVINRQKRVFYIETRAGQNYPGGSNQSIVHEIANLGLPNFENPTHDFLSHVRNYLDVFKYAILCGFFWVTLAVVFLAGTNIGDLLALGYLIGAFVFLWEGSDYYLRPIQTIIRRWKWLITYNVVNIVVKTCLQMAGCLFKDTLTKNCCWLVHILGITCSSNQIHHDGDEDDIWTGDCPVIKRHVALLWDAICFAFLILQLRIFKSYYFCHIIIDTKANNILASRGAEIIEDLRQKQIEHRQEHEQDVLVKIKRKMERIRATQQKMLKPAERISHVDEASDTVAVQMAPLAHNSSFSSCQGSGYHTPDDDDEGDDESRGASSSTVTSSESAEERAKLIDNIESGQPVSFKCDALTLEVQAEYADVNSLSETGDNALAEDVIRLRLPEIDIQTNAQQTTPSSDLTTLPLDGFLDVNRISLGSAPNSDMATQRRDDSDESSEVFSPPPYESVRTRARLHTLMPPVPTSCSLTVNVSGGSSIISSNLTANDGVSGGRHRRQSSVNAVSWNETVSIKCASKETTPSVEESEDVAVTLRQRSLHRRHLSMGNATYSMDDRSILQDGNRRYSNVSWARAETAIRAKARPHSWGPVGTAYLDSLMCDIAEATLHGQYFGNPLPGSRIHKRIKLHPQAVRAGDYYMFEDLDDKFELDMIEDEKDFLEDEDTSKKRLSRRKTLANVWKDIQNAEIRRQVYLRQRSYASAPGSRIGIKFDEELEVQGEVGVRTSTHSDPVNYGVHSSPTDDFVEQSNKEEASTVESKEIASAPSTSKQAPPEKPTESKTKKETEISEESYKDSDDEIEANPIARLLEGFVVSVTMFMNRFSRNYRYVNKILCEEKTALKDSKHIHDLVRSGASTIFATIRRNINSDDNEGALAAPSSSVRTSNDAQNELSAPPQSNTNRSNNESAFTTANVPPIQSQAQAQLLEQQPSPTPDQSQSQIPHVVNINEISQDTIDARNISYTATSSSSLTKGRKSEALPEIRIKAPSIDRSRDGSGSLSKQWSYDKVDSVAEFALQEEDFTTRDHHILIEFLISSWYALLSNTDLICYIVVFINQVVNASIISLPLPIMVFMWGTLSLPRPTKTFWVTMIAYTQANVLIKCIFQYKLIWANYINLPNQPLAPAKIFGVELNPNYASYDLLLLLVLFFHRFILKLHGLWKSEYRDSVRMRMAASGSVNELRDQVKVQITANENIVPQSNNNLDQNQTNNNSTAVEHGKYADAINRLKNELEREEEDETNVANENTRPNSDNGNQSDDRSQNAESGKYTKKIKRLKRTRYFSSVHKFFVNLVKKPRLPSDVYALMFLCDFINFFVLLFGFTAFGSQQSEGEGNGGVQTYLAENKVPIPFLIMLLVQFILIVIDRALYLRKALVNKIIFHFLSVIGIHIWMFFIVPLVTERSFYSLAPPIIFYIIKCFYMLLSSYQIKCGYPKRILGNFLTKGFSLANMISFKVYMLIPFLYELRTILDWVCTDTTMTLFDWLKMEDIFSDIYFIKCSRQMETDFPAIRAQKKPLISKLFMGGTIILLIVVSIWGPLCLFALGNAVGQSNLPIEVSMSIRIGSYDPIYQTQNRESTIAFDENMYTSMQNAYIKDKAAITFLSGYDSGDIAAIKLAGNSPSLWTISPPDKERLLKELKNDTTMVTRFTYSFTRIPPAKGLVGTVSSEVTHELNEEFNGREAMINMLEGHPTSDVVVLPNIMPKFIKVLNSGEVGVVQVLMSRNQTYRPLIIKMHSASENGTGIWWEIRDFCNDTYHTNVLSKLPLVNCNSGVVLYTFNDKKFPSTFSFLTAGGIIGLYTTFVLLASRVLKSFIAGQNRKIMFEDLPYVDRVLQLCLDIYLVREALEFALEEDLFAKLIFLYRSPETMIKWTRPKEETNEDETDTESVRSRHSTRRPESSIVT